jgi:vitamin B12 transporter
MNQISGFCRVFLLISFFFAPVLGAEEISPTPSTEATVESVANTATSRATLVLSEVVITANRLQTPVSQVASSMTLITRKDLDRRQSNTVLQALRQVPALDAVQNGNPGQNSSVFIRGANSEQTLFLLDGIPLNDPGSTAKGFDDLDLLYLDDVKQIEVVRGPQSSLYGSNAMGGVVNIVTKKAEGSARGSFLFEGGAYGTFREALTTSVGGLGGGIRLTASRFDTAGFPAGDKALGNVVNNGNNNTTASLTLEAPYLPGFENNITARYVNSRTSLSHGGGAGVDDPRYFVEGQQFTVGTRSSLKLFEGAWEQVLGLSFADHFRRFTDDIDAANYPFSFDERGTFDGQLAQLDWQNNIQPWEGGTLVAGLQAQQEWINIDDISDYGFGPDVTDIEQSVNSIGAFAEARQAVGTQLFLAAGGRLDSQSQFGSHWTYRGTATFFIPGSETKLKATYGTGFKSPSLYQLYSIYGSTVLLPESSSGWDVGFEQPLLEKNLSVGAAYFRSEITDLIDFVSEASPPYGHYFNVSKARTEGVETFLSAVPVKDLELRASYTYTEARNLTADTDLLRRPRNKASFGASYRWDKTDLGLDLIYVGSRVDYPAVAMSEYALVNLMASYELDNHVKLFGRVNNLFDTHYQEVKGYGTPGLSIYAGTKLSI